MTTDAPIPDEALSEAIKEAWRIAVCYGELVPDEAADVELVARALASAKGDSDVFDKFTGDHWETQRDVYRDDARAALAALAAAGRLRAPVLFEVERWKVDLPQGSVKGIAESDARRLAAEHGGTASRSVVRLLTDGTEELDSWQKVSGS